jgi:ketosteroid isomerase-like protein
MKKITGLLSLLTMMTLTFFACTTVEKQEPIDLSNLRTEIQAMEDAYSAAEKAKDAEAVVAYYSDDAISYSRNQQPVSGKAAIMQDIANRLATDTTGMHSVYKVVDLFAEGNLAVEIGSWTRIDASGTETESGHYMSFFEKRDGKYQCVRDMNVSSNPTE